MGAKTFGPPIDVRSKISRYHINNLSIEFLDESKLIEDWI